MKGLYVSLLIVVVIVFAVSVSASPLEGPQSDCPEICTFDYTPVCGYDGKCYHIYGNECTFKSDRCKNKQDLRTVDMKMCDEALERSNPDVVPCAQE